MRAVLALMMVLAQENAAGVVAEFRVFAGTEEITATTRLRMMPTGTREKPVTLEEGKRPVLSVTPGIYDVQALRLRHGGIAAITWAERLVIMRYPDEGGRHLEVINFQSGYGALQLRVAKGAITAYELAVFPTGDRTQAAGDPIEGDGYKLFVLKPGQYDIRVQRAGAQKNDEEPRWILSVEVPADRTRMKTVDTERLTPPSAFR